MAVSVEYQAWTSVNYNWLDKTTATSAPLQINDKLDAWVAAVNANASNANKQITVERDPSNSTSANFVGWVIKLASNSANATTYAAFFTNTASALTLGSYTSWTAGTANGGYGTLAGNSSVNVSSTFKTSGSSAEFLVATETTDTEEFFCVAWKTDSTSVSSSSGCLLLFKDTAGEWVVLGATAGSIYGSFYLPTHTTPTRQYGLFLPSIGVQNTSAGFLDPLILTIENSTYLPAAGNAVTVISAPKSPYLLASKNTSAGFQFGRYATLPGPRTAVCMGYSPVFVSYA